VFTTLSWRRKGCEPLKLGSAGDTTALPVPCVVFLGFAPQDQASHQKSKQNHCQNGQQMHHTGGAPVSHSEWHSRTMKRNAGRIARLDG
jgi:hypothetical protein